MRIGTNSSSTSRTTSEWLYVVASMAEQPSDQTVTIDSRMGLFRFTESTNARSDQSRQRMEAKDKL